MIYLLIIVVIAGSEYLIKNHMESKYKSGDRKEIFGGRVILHKYYNKGAFLNFMENKKEIVKTVSLVFLGLLLLLFAFMLPKKGSRLFKLGCAIGLGGAISNVSDRYRRGYVVDYFSFNFPKLTKLKNIIFNLADIAIFIGAFLAFLSSVFSAVIQSGADKASK